ncbi:MAG: ATP-binding cassette domain-containing protein [Rhodospirillales bacterium]|nr:ATP-binding cassette domain-containing protein [Rhodospirillales bacterium]
MTSAASNSNQANIIEIRDLVAHYGSRQVLNSVNLDVREGEIMVIMGGSGSGKSTLLRHVLALEHMTSGTVRVLGVDLGTATTAHLADLRKKIGVAFQGGALFSSINVERNVMLPLYELTDLDPMQMRIMARMKLQVVGLAGFEQLMPSELSGGMIKRAAFARAIAMDPRILFCDEPSAGLDPAVASAIDDLILGLRDAMNMTIVVVTHELDSAFKIADRITVLDQGDVLFSGTPEQLRNHTDERIQNLLNRRPQDDTIDPDDYLRRLTGTGDNPSMVL